MYQNMKTYSIKKEVTKKLTFILGSRDIFWQASFFPHRNLPRKCLRGSWMPQLFTELHYLMMYCIKIVFVVGMKKSTRTRRVYVEIYCNILHIHDMSIQKKLIFRCEFLPFSVWHIYLCIMKKKNWYCMIHSILF